jgi:hydrogenase large subunit
VCGICSVSQSIAAAAALRELAGGRAADNGALATNIAHAAENVADHLTHFYLFFMPDFARPEYSARRGFEATARRFKAVTGEAAREVLPARRRLLEIMGVLAGKWPHCLAFQPGGTTRAIGMGERVQLLCLVAEFQTFLESALFGVALDRVLALESLAELDAFADGPGRAGDFAAFLRLAADLRLDEVGRGPGPLMSFGAYHGADGPLFARGLRQGERSRRSTRRRSARTSPIPGCARAPRIPSKPKPFPSRKSRAPIPGRRRRAIAARRSRSARSRARPSTGIP